MMTVGQAAEALGVSTKMIRHYEAVGLLQPLKRSSAGNGVLTLADLHTLVFVKRARDLGFLLVQIGALLAFWQDG